MRNRKIIIFSILFLVVLIISSATNHYFIHPPDAVLGNSNSHIYHTLECSAGKQIKEEHKIYFDNSEEALKQKYKPCKICNPK